MKREKEAHSWAPGGPPGASFRLVPWGKRRSYLPSFYHFPSGSKRGNQYSPPPIKRACATFVRNSLFRGFVSIQKGNIIPITGVLDHPSRSRCLKSTSDSQPRPSVCHKKSARPSVDSNDNNGDKDNEYNKEEEDKDKYAVYCIGVWAT